MKKKLIIFAFFCFLRLHCVFFMISLLTGQVLSSNFKKRIEKLLKSTNESYNLLDGELKDIVGKMQWEINENTSRLDKSILNSLNYMNNIYSCLNVSLNRSEHNNIVLGDFINYGEID